MPWRVEPLRSVNYIHQVVETDASVTHNADCCYETSLEDISMPAVEEQYPTLYDYVYFVCQLMFIFEVPHTKKNSKSSN